MNRPPMFIGLGFGKQCSKFKLWFPLFILFPFLVIILLLISPLLLLTALVLWSLGWGKPFLIFIPLLLRLLWALRGLEIAVNDKGGKVFISIK
ncbi:hypothetical protein ACFLUJ_04205 [Chloroflexota bacterium]